MIEVRPNKVWQQILDNKFEVLLVRISQNTQNKKILSVCVGNIYRRSYRTWPNIYDQKSIISEMECASFNRLF